MQARGKFPLIWTPNKEYTGDTVMIAAETDDLKALIAYVQKLGMNRGKWRDLFEPQQLEVTDATLPRSNEWIAYGKEVYERRCIGCHGTKGDGNGPAATFLFNQRPRNFTAGVFKFRLSQKPVPTDGDLLRTITRGVRGTAMPAWYELPLTDRLAVIQYIKYELAVDRTDHDKALCLFHRGTARPAAVHWTAAGALARDTRARQGGVAERQVLGVPWPDRQGRRRKGCGAEGRFRLSCAARRSHQRSVQIRSGGAGYLQDHEHRVERHANALL